MDISTKAAIHKNLKGIYNLSPMEKDEYFSKAPCECCGSKLAGNRYEFLGTCGREHGGERIRLSCCVDCFGYLFG